MQKYQKWLSGAIVSWIVFLVILFGAVVKKTSIINEYSCTVQKFDVDPRFECNTRCPIFPDSDLKQFKAGPDCDELENDTLEWYSPELCLRAKWGFEDPLCPPDNAVCYVGDKWKRKCYLSCPLGYDVTVGLDVGEDIGYVEKERDLGTDRERFESYKDFYNVGDTLTCQVVKMRNGDDGEKHDFLWLDERVSSKTMNWWKWTLFSMSVIATVFTTMGSIASFVKYRNRRDGYNAIGGGDEH